MCTEVNQIVCGWEKIYKSYVQNALSHHYFNRPRLMVSTIYNNSVSWYFFSVSTVCTVYNPVS